MIFKKKNGGTNLYEEIKPRKLTGEEKKYLLKNFPKLSKKTKKENKMKRYRLKIVDVNRLEFLEKLSERTENYIQQIMIQIKKIQEKNNEIAELNNKIDDTFEILKLKEEQRRKNASKAGGLQRSLNSFKKKNDKLIEERANLADELENKNIELELKEKEIQMLKNKDSKKKDVETYKNYFHARKELEKREKKKKGE